MSHFHQTSKHQGFTLIEVLLVIVLVGMMISVVQFSFSGNKPDEILKQSSARFAGIFEIAAEYGLLNNIELGLLIRKNSYQFLGFDGVKWSEISSNKLLNEFQLPENVELVLQLEDLPIDEAQLFDASLFNQQQEEYYLALEQDQDEESNREQASKRNLPQIYMLSGGDITPFSLTFRFSELSMLAPNLSYQVNGLYSADLVIEGPLFDE